MTLFTPTQLDQLRSRYGTLQTIDPTSPVYKQVVSLLDGMDVEQLRQIANAQIQFIGLLAQNRLAQRGL